jgi:hypothetical protein
MKITDAVVAVPKVNPVQNHQNSGHYSPPQTTPKASHENKEAQPTAGTDTMPSADRILLSRLEGANDQAQMTAQQIREVDNIMHTIGESVQKMLNSLESIVKVFPPYPTGSNERIQALRRFSGLRQIIDQLTVPPPDDSPAKILGDKTFPDAGDWEFNTGGNAPPLTIRHQPIHIGAGGLDIPDLPLDATDDALHDAMSKLAKAADTLLSRHSGFIADANRIIKAMC